MKDQKECVICHKELRNNKFRYFIPCRWFRNCHGSNCNCSLEVGKSCMHKLFFSQNKIEREKYANFKFWEKLISA
jgi:hypothetical protein